MFMLFLIQILTAKYIIQYYEDSQVDADIVIGDFKVSFESNLDKFKYRQLKTSGDVKRIMKSKNYRKSVVQKIPPSWGLDRIDARAGKDKLYNYPDSAGYGTVAYVLDTGINIDHVDFEGRASFGFDATGEGDEDLDGHGSHCAGIIGGATYGVAKKIQLISVKVLNKAGEGEDYGIIRGLHFAVRDARIGRYKAVINMSLGGEYSQILNDAVTATIKEGIPVVVAAGNDNIDACTESPGSAELAITVGSVGKNDRKSSFSSHGHCVDIFAPGEGIKSTYKGNKLATHLLSGTSMAAPHITGIAALYLAEGIAPQDVQTKLMEYGTFNAISDLDEATNNILAYNQVDMQHDIPRRRGSRRHRPLPRNPVIPF